MRVQFCWYRVNQKISLSSYQSIDNTIDGGTGMTRRVQLFVLTAMLATVLAACNRPLLGIVTETYVSQNDARRSLELMTKETLKGFIGGRSPNPAGSYTLLDEQKVTSGEYARVEGTYILKLNENHEFKIAVQQDGSLRDESGGVWRHQSRSRSFRPPDGAKTLNALK
jgi:hypothetical protein